MNGLVTDKRFARVLDLPISFAQTEIRAGGSMLVAAFPLTLFQRLELRSLTITLINILTPNIIPAYLNTALGLCSVGLYRSTMLTSPLAYATYIDQTSTANPFSPCIIETPGTYVVIVSNNTNNADLSVCATGSIKLFY